MTSQPNTIYTWNDFTVRWLTKEDFPVLQELLVRCTDFFEMIYGEPPAANAAEKVATDGPPGRSLEGKFLFGVFDASGGMTAVIEGFRGYPEEDVYWIGLFLIDPASRKKGVGGGLMNGFFDWARKEGAAQIGLGVQENNTNAFAFWQHMGFKVLDLTWPRKVKDKEFRIYRMRKTL